MIGHLILFFMASFVGYVLNVNRFAGVSIGFNIFGTVLFLLTLIGGVYYLGWLALVTFVAGLFLGGVAFVKSGLQ